MSFFFPDIDLENACCYRQTRSVLRAIPQMQSPGCIHPAIRFGRPSSINDLIFPRRSRSSTGPSPRVSVSSRPETSASASRCRVLRCRTEKCHRLWAGASHVRPPVSSGNGQVFQVAEDSTGPSVFCVLVQISCVAFQRMHLRNPARDPKLSQGFRPSRQLRAGRAPAHSGSDKSATHAHTTSRLQPPP